MAESSKKIDGRFVLEELIGKGGVGEVWRASQLPVGRKVALKLLREEFSGNLQLRRRFAREARAASSLSQQNVAAVYDFGSDEDERLFIAMELIEGPSLADAIEEGISYRHILELSIQLLSGLAHAHARGVIHRDLKPDNIVLAGARLPDTLGTPKLVDFGIATVTLDNALLEDADDVDTMQGEVVGTPRYMSPEQAIGERNLGPRTDIYNVGLVIYELVTGSAPFGDDKGLAVMSRHVHDPIPPMIPRPGLQIPPEFHEVVMRSLEKTALDRWSSAAEMRQALEELLDDVADDPSADDVPDAVAPRDDTPTPVSDVEKHVEKMRVTEEEVQDELVERSKKSTHQPGEEVAFDPWNYRIPFVGREDERRLLMGLVNRAVDEGRGTIVLMSGEAGVGKTRLTNWLKEQVEERGLMRANPGAFTRGGSSGLRGAQEVLESMFRTRGLPRDRVAEKVAKRLSDWGYASDEDALVITDFIRPASLDDTRPVSFSQAAVFATVARIIEIGARRKPRLIILDDIHWAGRELADFLDYMAVELRHRSVPILLVGTIRTEDLAERPELESRLSQLSRYVGETVERIELDRFEGGRGRELVNTLLPCEDELADIILERSGGNPLHLSLLLRYLRQEDLLEWHDGKWRAAELDEVRSAVPPSLGDLFRVRIEQVEAHYNISGRLFQLLEYAAILGFRFQYDVLRQMIELSDEPELIRYFDYDLDRVLSEGLFVDTEGRGEDWYAFSHGLLRDFLQHQVGPVMTRRLHGLAAQAFEAVMGSDSDAFAFDIARHWRAAREPDRALLWYQRAARNALGSFSLRQAAASYEAALELMDAKLGIEPSTLEPLGPGLERKAFAKARVSVADYLETLSRLGDLYEGFGDYSASEIAYRRVVRLVGRDTKRLSSDVVAPLGYSWLGLGHVAWQRGDFEAADWAFRKVREIVKRHDAHARLDAEATRGLARVAWHRSEYERAAELAAAARKASRDNDDPQGEADSIWLLGEVARIQGRAEEARDYYLQSVEIHKDAGLPSGVARNLLSLAQIARYQKDFSAARDLYQKSLAHYENLGERRGQGQCHNGLGDVARLEQRHSEANQRYRHALDIYESIGAEYDVAVVLANLGINALRLGDYEGAEEYLHAALSIVSAGDYPYLLAGIEYNLALVKGLEGEEEDVQELIGKVMDWSERVPIADIDYAQPLEQLGRLRAEAGSWDEARALWQKARALYDELGLDEDRDRVAAYLDS